MTKPAARKKLLLVAVALAALVSTGLALHTARAEAHGGGLNRCGCHFNRRTGECHCHRDYGCGCECQPDRCE